LTKEGYAPFVVREKAIMDFLLNLTVVLMLFGGVYGITELRLAGLTGTLVVQLVAVGLGCLITFWLLIQGAAGWGMTIRSAFVIFRESLRQELGLRQTQGYVEERTLWGATSDFFRAESADKEQVELGQQIFG
jgi:hypothetical protein